MFFSNSGITVIAVPSRQAQSPRTLVPNSNRQNQSKSDKYMCQKSDNYEQISNKNNFLLPPSNSLAPHMMHWSPQYPRGQPIPLRQPTPPVYYNQPTNSCSSSGTQSPNSMSPCEVPSDDSGCSSQSSCDKFTFSQYQPPVAVPQPILLQHPHHNMIPQVHQGPYMVPQMDPTMFLIPQQYCQMVHQ